LADTKIPLTFASEKGKRNDKGFSDNKLIFKEVFSITNFLKEVFMKKVFMTLVATLFVSATLFAANKSSEAKWEGNIDSYKLGEYLKLNSDQSDEVSDICDYFAEQMQRANSSKSDSKKLLHNAVYGNLKLMKKVLTSEQYKKYATVLNLTLRNNNIVVDADK